MDVTRGDDRHISLFEIGHVTGMGKHGHDVGCDERRLGGCAYDQRASRSCRDHRPRLSLRRDGEGIAATHILRGSSYGLRQIHSLLEIFIDQMRHNLRVRFRMKSVALFLQLVFQRLIVFDNAVVYQHAAFRAVRVGILLRGFSVRRPSRVADPHGATKCFLFE